MMPWQSDAPTVPICGMCSLALNSFTHRFTRHPVGWVAVCSQGSGPLSDITDQTLLADIAAGSN
jgi:hypothetical protein